MDRVLYPIQFCVFQFPRRRFAGERREVFLQGGAGPDKGLALRAELVNPTQKIDSRLRDVMKHGVELLPRDLETDLLEHLDEECGECFVNDLHCARDVFLTNVGGFFPEWRRGTGSWNNRITEPPVRENERE